MRLASSGSELYLGGANVKLYTSKIETHAVYTSTGFWQSSCAFTLVGITAAVTGFKTVIDSGATIMYGPPAVVRFLGVYLSACATKLTMVYPAQLARS